jgi:hypothetical protein
MLDSTYPTDKTREEQQQMWAKLLFYHSKKNIGSYSDNLIFCFIALAQLGQAVCLGRRLPRFGNP